jgi:hypothetical protein
VAQAIRLRCSSHNPPGRQQQARANSCLFFFYQQWTWREYSVELEPNGSISVICDLAIENSKGILGQALNITSRVGSGNPIIVRSTNNLGDGTDSKTQVRVNIKNLNDGTVNIVRFGHITIGR